MEPGADAQHGVDAAARLLIEASVPAQRRVVVVRAGVDDAVVLVHVGQVRVVALAAEGELQDAHARQAEALAQRHDVVGDDAEILGDDRQVAELVHQQPQEILPRREVPLSPAGVRGAGGHGPVRRERAKVIDAQQVDALELLAHARAPVGEVVVAHRLPVIERVAPELAGLREVIRRNAGDGGRPPVGLRAETARGAPRSRRNAARRRTADRRKCARRATARARAAAAIARRRRTARA